MHDETGLGTGFIIFIGMLDIIITSYKLTTNMSVTCQEYIQDLKPELGTGLPGRWRLRPTLPGSRVTRRATRLATLAWRKWRSREKKMKKKILTIPSSIL